MPVFLSYLQIIYKLSTKYEIYHNKDNNKDNNKYKNKDKKMCKIYKMLG